MTHMADGIQEEKAPLLNFCCQRGKKELKYSSLKQSDG